MDAREVKQCLLTDFFTYYPMGGALYDENGMLIEVNKSICGQFSIANKADFLLSNLFDTDLLSDIQKEALRGGYMISDQVPVGFSIIPSLTEEGKCVGYTLLLTDQLPKGIDTSRYDKKRMEMDDMSRKAVEAIQDTIILVNDKLIVERIIAYAVDTCLTSAIEHKRIDTLAGIVYPKELKIKMSQAVRTCLDTSEVLTQDVSISGPNDRINYFKIRMVPMHGRYVVVYIRDMTEQIEKQKENEALYGQLAENQMMMELALENSKVTTFSFNFERFHTCDKINCNHCFQFHGATNSLLRKNEYICRSLPMLSHPEDKKGFFSLFHMIRERRLTEYQIDFRLKNDEDSYRMYEVIGKTHEMDKDGYPRLIVGCMIDDQERLDFERDLIRAKEKAEEADLLKSTFLANMTHEIRTPLNAIVGFSDLLSMEDDPELRDNYSSLIRENNELLLSVVNDVLDISRIESDMIVFSYQDIYLPSFMRDLYSLVLPRLQEGVELILDPCLDLIFNIDRNRLKQICSSLLTNSIKNTRKGHIRFGYTLMEKEGQIRFFVSDTGCGIPKNQRENIFTRFVQLCDFEQGVGLGLSISRGLITKMGGRMSLTSEEGEGSTFEFTLPLKRPNSWK